MDIEKVIFQLRESAPLFGGNVAGAAAYANAVDSQGWLPQPAAYVIPLDDDAENNTQETGFYQLVTERIGVIVDFYNGADRRGQTASEQLLAVRYAIYRAILNWRPDFDPLKPFNPQNREARGIFYVGGRLLDFDRARLFYQFEFGLETTLTELDGWQQPSAALTDIRITVARQDTLETLATADVALPAPPAPRPSLPQAILNWLRPPH